MSEEGDERRDEVPAERRASEVDAEISTRLRDLANQWLKEAGDRHLVPAPGYAVRASTVREVVEESIREFRKEFGVDGEMYHADSDGLLSAVARGEEPGDIPELLGTRWRAARTEGSVTTVDMLTPSCPGVDHKPSSEATDRHVVVPTRSMCEAFGRAGQHLSWATSDVVGRTVPCDVIAIAEAMESTRGMFEDVLRNICKEKRVPADTELTAEVEDRVPMDDLPDPKFSVVKLPGGAQLVIADYKRDEAVVIAPYCAVDILMGERYAYVGAPIVVSRELSVMVERLHERRTLERKLKVAERLPVVIPPVGFTPPWG